MPTIAIVDGVRILIYFRDHLPPHVHASFGGSEMQVSIATGEVLNGALPAAKAHAVRDWLHANRDHVAYMWREARAGRPVGKVIP